MKDIRSLYEAAKASGRDPDISSYQEAVRDLLEHNPNEYLLQLEYIIQSSIGLPTLTEFVEKQGLPIPAYDHVISCLEKCLHKCTVFEKDPTPYQEAISFMEGFRRDHVQCFAMYEFYRPEDDTTKEKQYIRTYYGESNGRPNRFLVMGMLDRFGEMAFPDMLITAQSVGDNAVKTMLEYVNTLMFSEPPLFCEWIDFTIGESNPHAASFIKRSCSAIINNMRARNNAMFQEAAINGKLDELKLMYTREEAHVMQDMISFKEYIMTWGDEINIDESTYDEILGLYEELQQVTEDIADSVIPMLPTAGGTPGVAEEGGGTWMGNTHDKKTGQAPLYLSRNHDMGWGEDDSGGSDGDKDPEDYRRPSAKSVPSQPEEPEDEPEESDGQDSATGSVPTPTNNYYYYTYNNSLNQNSNSFNHQLHDDHSTGKRINSHDIQGSDIHDIHRESAKNLSREFQLFGVEFELPAEIGGVHHGEVPEDEAAVKEKAHNKMLEMINNPKQLKKIENAILEDERAIGEKGDTDEIRIERIKKYLSKASIKKYGYTPKGNAIFKMDIPYIKGVICAWEEHEMWITSNAKVEPYDAIEFYETPDGDLVTGVVGMMIAEAIQAAAINNEFSLGAEYLKEDGGPNQRFQYAYKAAYNYENGHALKITYSLDGVVVTDVGELKPLRDEFLSVLRKYVDTATDGKRLSSVRSAGELLKGVLMGRYNVKNRRKFITELLNEHIKEIGYVDFQAKGCKIVEIYDRADKKPIEEPVQMVGVFAAADFNQERALVLSDYAFKRMRQRVERRHSTFQVYTIKVGDIQRVPTFMTTHWGDHADHGLVDSNGRLIVDDKQDRDNAPYIQSAKEFHGYDLDDNDNVLTDAFADFIDPVKNLTFAKGRNHTIRMERDDSIKRIQNQRKLIYNIEKALVVVDDEEAAEELRTMLSTERTALAEAKNAFKGGYFKGVYDALVKYDDDKAKFAELINSLKETYPELNDVIDQEIFVTESYDGLGGPELYTESIFDGKKLATCKLKKLPATLKGRIEEANEFLCDEIMELAQSDDNLRLDRKQFDRLKRTYMSSYKKKRWFSMVGFTSVRKKSEDDYIGEVIVLPDMTGRAFQRKTNGYYYDTQTGDVITRYEVEEEDPAFVKAINALIKRAYDNYTKKSTSHSDDDMTLKLVGNTESEKSFSYIVYKLSPEYSMKLFSHIKDRKNSPFHEASVEPSADDDYLTEGLWDAVKKGAKRIGRMIRGLIPRKTLSNLQSMDKPERLRNPGPLMLIGTNIPVKLKGKGRSAAPVKESIEIHFENGQFYYEGGDVFLSKNDIKNVINRLKSKYQAEIILISDNTPLSAKVAAAVETTREYIDKLARGAEFDITEMPTTILNNDGQKFERVIMVNVKALRNLKLKSTEYVELMIAHEYGHIQTFDQITTEDWIEYNLKVNTMSQLVGAMHGDFLGNIDDPHVLAELNFHYYKLKPEFLANKAAGIDPRKLCEGLWGAKPTGHLDMIDLQKIVDWHIPKETIDMTLRQAKGEEATKQEMIAALQISAQLYKSCITDADTLKEYLEALENAKENIDEYYESTSDPRSIYDVHFEYVGEADFDKPQSDHPVKDTLQDIDRALLSKGQKGKKVVQDIQNTGKALMKPVKRTQNWINNMISRFKDADETRLKENLADPHARSGIYKACRWCIINGSLLKAGLLLNPIILFLRITHGTSNKMKEKRIRNEMIGELKAEIEICEEKIKDADSKRDLKAKYQMMRFKNELNKKLVRVGGERHWRKII